MNYKVFHSSFSFLPLIFFFQMLLHLFSDANYNLLGFNATYTFSLCPGDCGGHGRCDVGSSRCQCHQGWGGPDCSLPVCSTDCTQHGHGHCDKVFFLLQICDVGSDIFNFQFWFKSFDERLLIYYINFFVILQQLKIEFCYRSYLVFLLMSCMHYFTYPKITLHVGCYPGLIQWGSKYYAYYISGCQFQCPWYIMKSK